MLNPEAFYDTLTIVRELAHTLGGISRLEVQRTAFLSCLLALYRSRPLAEWGYRFARTEYGTPYSAEINDALDFFVGNGWLIDDETQLRLNLHRPTFDEPFTRLKNFSTRDQYLHAACGSALAVPRSIFSEGVDNEPTIQSALHRSKGGGLLEGPGLRLLYEHFEGLSTVLDSSGSDLITPSVVWLSYAADQPVSKKQFGDYRDG